MASPDHDRWAHDEARDRNARDTARYRAGLVWLAVLVAGLGLAAVVAYLVFVAFSEWFGL